MTANPTAPRFISPRTSSRSSPSPTGFASTAFQRPRSGTPISKSDFLITEDFGEAGVIEGDPPAPIVERYEAATDMLAALHRENLAGNPAADAARQPRHPRLRRRRLAGRDRADARMVPARSRRRANPGAARRIHRDVAPTAGKACRGGPNLGDAGLSFAQPDLARRSRRNIAGWRHRLPGRHARTCRL